MTGGDAAVADAFQAGRIPQEISVAYLDEDRDTPSMAASIAMFVLTLVVVNGRAFSRFFLRKSFGVDDALAVIGMAMFIAFVPLCIILINIGSGRHFEYIQYVMTQDTLEETEILDFTAHLIYSTALLFCRYSGLAFYYRVCGIHNGFLRSIKGLAGFLFVGWLTQMLLIVFHCLPVTAIWPYEWQTQFNQFKCLPWGFVYGINSAVSLLCDFVLFGIPIAMLRMLEMTRKRKIQLACILLPGILVVAISVVRLILVINGQWQPDQSWIYSPLLAIEVAEIGATLIALSIPGIRPLVEETYNRVIIWTSRHFPCCFRRRRDDMHGGSWDSEASTWRNDPTPRQADFKMKDIEEVLGLELEAIEKYESKTKPKRVSTKLDRESKVAIKEMMENRI
ncbi:Satratoxin biosynthesis SC1 cluster protein 4 [Colletotrichum siamense]|uniref:Satratoxin biosynthesis SC1 cluster protein 4 n=1 Tax=Colletotrichum siamense TaxID=690259 RepID=A0A9P5BU03_COLSI|nr:Satratoxin biosynthesis SC1 cluster protein 4 [Colletotrichum siamense]KAF4812779.1 Satratoxin biosynthesis SC1 cluster protein 4 [Colletotrichum tropicale]KAI8164370.1 Satratoxin biosynthesis SC1 cluster protein 4 [Colletotrichum sp. SAR 10_71]KAI8185017.1 Satratoxin biosynthesis SC1 cluster protein 4 [Colletotrichum sp. SAR 10_75]KAI8189595.1 Satratoxin biosynthesis SC1 cluster protein 4 [Colletotrichum sp. SAR 10_70]KAI8250808.1 Satratoxin biosynthesis SC1 cluster protein 4 [Colletotrich